ncbi:MAG TPA: 5-amino-6-(D-ribitylamino)uracil--L-tyrosine 4-hydroxyphenyl transferase CofH [Candidatus Polarisedimenticolia bacterium]|nr:5-amino-6-(D-ribitylamino)uracil--L-tyrosine 4-hydroxyphenyl transferase CofH [Candidatus Polarisedimenticolia bacterium]
MLKAINPRWRDVSWEQAVRSASRTIAAVLEKSLAGENLDFDDGIVLCGAAEEDLLAVIKVADELRRRAVGERVTYVVNRNLNFTNVCIVGCAFCGFGRGPHSSDAYFHSAESLVAKSVEAVERGATEVCIQGGLPRDLNGAYYADLLRAIKLRLPNLHLHAYSPMEIVYGVEKTGMNLPEYLRTLKEAGLGSIPGTAAEILDDDVRRVLSPNKLKVRQWIEVIRTAHELGIPSTSTMMYGHAEEPQHWVRHLLLLREIQMDTSGFTEFVPLGFVHSQTRLFRTGRARPGSSLTEHLLVHALARLLLNGHINNIQVSWVKLGFEAALACLEAGANDFGGTLMEESISKAAGANFGESVSPGELRALIRTIGRAPAERTTTYKIRQVFGHPDANESLPLDRMAARPENSTQAEQVGY